MRVRRGFTLIELLVVIAIIGVLAGMVMGGVMIGLKKANQTKDANNLRGIGQAAVIYSHNHRFFPHYGDGSNGVAGENDADGSLLSLSLLVRERLIDNPEVFISPDATMVAADMPDLDDKDALAEFTLAPENCSYGWARRVRKPGNRSSLPLAATAYIAQEDGELTGDGVDPYQCFDDGVNVLYIDGRVSWVSLSDADEISHVVEQVVVSEGLEAYADQ